jgi:hypothetical protein
MKDLHFVIKRKNSSALSSLTRSGIEWESLGRGIEFCQHSTETGARKNLNFVLNKNHGLAPSSVTSSGRKWGTCGKGN